MSEKNIVICDKEVKYAAKLMENIMERNEFAVKMYVCSTWENVNYFRKTGAFIFWLWMKAMQRAIVVR